jgi:hypothetical protein
MSSMNRFVMDRRCGDDRRKSYRLGYFLNGGVERRSRQERRILGERRVDWVRATEWSSVPGSGIMSLEVDRPNGYPT